MIMSAGAGLEPAISNKSYGPLGPFSQSACCLLHHTALLQDYFFNK